LKISPNTQAILLLTAPLLLGKGNPRSEILSLQEYNELARLLRELQRKPEDLLGSDRLQILTGCRTTLAIERLNFLLDRGLLLGQVLERWTTRGLWVISRADPHYPRRLKKHLKESAPSILYGCGELNLLRGGGLAVVGSRNVDESLLCYTDEVASLAAESGQLIVSGGARGVDQAAMLGALRSGGGAVGILADSLERTVLQNHYRQGLTEARLVLISPYDPAAGFQVGHAMQRNKYIYAMADAALVVNSDYQKGGTWAGAIEQLQKFRFCPVYVRPGPEKGLVALIEHGANTWPNPKTLDNLRSLLSGQAVGHEDSRQSLESIVREQTPSAKQQLLETVQHLLSDYQGDMTPESVGDFLGVSSDQAMRWLNCENRSSNGANSSHV